MKDTDHPVEDFHTISTILPVFTPPKTVLEMLELPESVHIPDVCCVYLSQQTSFTMTNLLNRGVKCLMNITAVTLENRSLNNKLCPFKLKRYVTLSPSSSHDVQVIFKPKVHGEYVVDVEIFCQDLISPQENRTYLLQLSASAEHPSLKILPDNVVIDFGEQLWGCTSMQSIKIQNVGRATVPIRLSISKKESGLCIFSFSQKNTTDVSTISLTLPEMKNDANIVTHDIPIFCHAKKPQNWRQIHLEEAEEFKAVLSLGVGVPIEDFCPLRKFNLQVIVGMHKLQVNQTTLSISASRGKSGRGTLMLMNTGNISIYVDMYLKPQRDNFALSIDNVVVPARGVSSVHVNCTPQPTRRMPHDNTVKVVLKSTLHALKYISVLGEIKTTETKFSEMPAAVNFGGVNLGQCQKLKFPFIPDNDCKVKVLLNQEGSAYKLLREDGAFVDCLKLSVVKNNKYAVWLHFSPTEVVGYVAELKVQVLHANRYIIPVNGYGGCSKLVLENISQDKTGSKYLDIGVLSPGTSIVRKFTIRNVGLRCCFVKTTFFDLSHQEFQPSQATVMPSSLILSANEATDLLVKISPSAKETDLCKSKWAYVASIKLTSGDEIARQHFVRNPGKIFGPKVARFNIPLSSTQREIVDIELNSMKPPVDSYLLLKKSLSVTRVLLLGRNLPTSDMPGIFNHSRIAADISRIEMENLECLQLVQDVIKFQIHPEESSVQTNDIQNLCDEDTQAVVEYTPQPSFLVKHGSFNVRNPGKISGLKVISFIIPLFSTQRDIVDMELNRMKPPGDSYLLLKKSPSVTRVGLLVCNLSTSDMPQIFNLSMIDADFRRTRADMKDTDHPVEDFSTISIILPVFTPPKTVLEMLELPESVHIPDVCCVYLSQQTSFTMTNLLNRGVKCLMNITAVTLGNRSLNNKLCPFKLKRYVTLSPSSSHDVQVIFKPKVHGEYVVDVEIFCQDLISPQENRTYFLQLSASAEHPSLKILPDNVIDFGEQLWGCTSMQSIKIQNVGLATVPIRLSISRKESGLCIFSFSQKNTTDVSTISLTLPETKNDANIVTHDIPIFCHAKKPQNWRQIHLEEAEEFKAVLSLGVGVPIEDFFFPLRKFNLQVIVGMHKLQVNQTTLSISASRGKSGRGTLMLMNTGNISIYVDMYLKPQRDNFALSIDNVVVPARGVSSVHVNCTPQPTRRTPHDNTVKVVLKSTLHALKYISVLGEIKTTETKFSEMPAAVNFGGVNLGQCQKLKFPFIPDNDCKVKVLLNQEGSAYKLLREDGAFVDCLKLSVVKNNKYAVWLHFSPTEVVGYVAELKVQVLHANRYIIPVNGYGGCSNLVLENISQDKTGSKYLDIGVLSPGTSIVRKFTIRNVGLRCCFVKTTFFDLSHQEFQPSQATVMPSSLILSANEATDLLVKISPSAKETDLCKSKWAYVASIKLTSGDEIARQHFVRNPGKIFGPKVARFNIPLSSTQREIVDIELNSMKPPVDSYLLLKKSLSVTKVLLLGRNLPTSDMPGIFNHSRIAADISRIEMENLECLQLVQDVIKFQIHPEESSVQTIDIQNLCDEDTQEK